MISVTKSTYNNASDVTTHPINYPASIQAGDLLFLFLSFDGNPIITPPAGWVKVQQWTNSNTGCLCVLKASGVLSGTFNVTTSASESGTAICYRVRGNSLRYKYGFGDDTGFGVNFNASPATSPTVILDSDLNNTFLLSVLTGIDDGSKTITTYPTGMTDTEYQSSGAGVTKTAIAGAYQISSLSGSQTPSWTHANASGVAFTLAVYEFTIASFLPTSIEIKKYGMMILKLIGLITSKRNSPNNITFATGKISRCGVFNGSNAEINDVKDIIIPQYNVSYASWFKTTDASGKKIMGAQTNPVTTISAGHDKLMYVATDGKLYGGVYDGATVRTVNTTFTVNDGLWHLAILVISATATSLYLDNVLIGSIPYISGDTANRLRVGGWSLGWPLGANGYFNGSLEGTGVWLRELLAGDRTELWNGGAGKLFSNFTAGLLQDLEVYYTFDNDKVLDVAGLDKVTGLFDGLTPSFFQIVGNEVDINIPKSDIVKTVDIQLSSSYKGVAQVLLLDDLFSYTYITPEITSISPSGALINEIKSFTIYGNYFRTGVTVKIDGVSCTDIVLVDSNTITAKCPISTVQKVSILEVKNTDNKFANFDFNYMLESLPPPAGDPVVANFEVEVISVLR